MKKEWLKATVFCLAGVFLLTACGGNQSAGGQVSEIPMEKEPVVGIAETLDADGTEAAADSGGAAEESAARDKYMADADAESLAGKTEYGILRGDSYLDSCYDYGITPGIAQNTEEYSGWEEKGFLSVLKMPLSTFAADVDTASYSNLRRLIREGYGIEDIPEGAVRIEEMLNYFSYDYKEPKGSDAFGVTTQIGKCPWSDETELLMIGLKTEGIEYDETPPANIVFLLDVSGSMGDEDKLSLLQESFGLLAENLTKKDRVSIVTYASEDRVVLKGARGDETQKILKAINSLQAGGGTYGSRGIERAYELAEEYFIKGGNNRIILATDGDLNIGLTSEEELEELITEKKKSGIFLSVLGFGTGNIKDNKMETLADKGNGNYAYIDCLREANKVLVEEMSATLLTICKDVKIQVEFNPSVVESYRLLGYENRALAKEDFHDDEKDGGEIGAGHSVTALYEIRLKEPFYEDMPDAEIDGLKYGDEYRKAIGKEKKVSDAVKKEWLTISIRYKRPAAKDSDIAAYPVGFESYSDTPSDDFRFAAAVAEFGLLASHSECQENASLKHVEKVLKSLDLKDEYKEEFYELVKKVQ